MAIVALTLFMSGHDYLDRVACTTLRGSFDISTVGILNELTEQSLVAKDVLGRAWPTQLRLSTEELYPNRVLQAP